MFGVKTTITFLTYTSITLKHIFHTIAKKKKKQYKQDFSDQWKVTACLPRCSALNFLVLLL